MKTTLTKFAAVMAVCTSLFSCSDRLWAQTPSAAAEVAVSPVFSTPLFWTGVIEPSVAESEALLSALETFSHTGVREGAAALEGFLGSYPTSPWAASLHADLAEFYKARGRFTPALKHWENAWNLARNGADAHTQELAVRAAAGWARLLACLGHKEQMANLISALENSGLPLRHYGVSINSSKARLRAMINCPGDAYRCGLFALNDVAKNLELDKFLKRRLLLTPAPAGGFSAKDLVELASTNEISLEVVRRTGSEPLALPCIVHWNVNHYAAVMEHKDGRYLVADPVLGGSGFWMEAEDFDLEASGVFLVPAGKRPNGWNQLSDSEASEVVGRGWPNIIPPPPPPPPPPCEPENCGPPEANDGSEGDPLPPKCCPDAGAQEEGPNATAGGGMPVWQVLEPYIDLWLKDLPLGYRLACGEWNSLRLNYNQRNEFRGHTISGFGPKWECGWLGMFKKQTDPLLILTQYPAGGGQVLFEIGEPEYRSGSIVTNINGLRPLLNQALPGYGVGGLPYTAPAIRSPIGAGEAYSHARQFEAGGTNYFMTHHVDGYGRASYFHYQAIGNSDRLLYVIDVDGRTNTLSYTNQAFINLITAVTDPYGRTARFIYDSLGRLTNIIDVAGLSSSFQYDSSDNITNMVTPYGSTAFELVEGNSGAPYSSENRSLRVTEPTGQKQLFAYCDNGPYGIGGDGYPSYRNSYHWNRAQYELISEAGKNSLLHLLDGDYDKATIKHWLHGAPLEDKNTVSDSLESTAGPIDPQFGYRAPIRGYRYQGQTVAWQIGTLKRVAQEYGDYTFSNIERNSKGRPLIITYYRPFFTCSYTNVYDSSGEVLLQQWGPSGELVRGYGYHPQIPNLLTSVTNAEREVTRYTHDINTMRMTSVTFPGGLVRTNFYYAEGAQSGFLDTTIDIGIRTNHFTYEKGNVATQTSPLGLSITKTWDELSRLVSIAYPDGTTRSNLYYRLDVIGEKNRLEDWTYYGYNTVRQLMAVTNVQGQVTQYSYCDCGSPSSIVRGLGAGALTNLFVYDIAGRLSETVYPDGYQVSRRYNPSDGMLKRIFDSTGRAIELEFTQLKLRFLLSKAYFNSAQEENLFLAREFDIYGNIIREQDRNGVVVTNAFDFNRRLIASRPESTVPWVVAGLEQFLYNSRGLTNRIDPLGKVTTYVRDAAGRTLFETNANDQVLQFTYDGLDNLVSLIDGKQQTTRWNYDEYGLATNKVDAASTTVFRYSYDPVGRLTNRWTAAKGNTYYAYDRIGNLTNVAHPTLTNKLRYDAFNRLTNIIDQAGSTAFTWTPGGQLASEDGPWPTDTVSYTYDARRRNTLALQQPGASAWRQDYMYDEASRLTSVTSAAGEFGTVYYSGVGDLVAFSYMPNGAQINTSFDVLGRLTASTLYAGGENVNSHDYAYNQGHQRTRQTFIGQNYVDYTYDKIGQLKTAKGSEADGTTPRLQEQFGYAYDAAWNLNWRTNNQLKQQFNVNNLNELTSAGRSGTLTVAGTTGGGNPVGTTTVTVSGTGWANPAGAEVYADGSWARAGAAPADGVNSYTAVAQDNYGRQSTDAVTVNLPASPSFTYDGNGNMTSDGSRVFEYDFENQLTNVYVAGKWRADFVYDAFMRRRVRRDYGWLGSAWTKTNEVRYLYDGKLVIQERDANNLPQVTYTRGNDLSGNLQGAGGIGGLLARTDHSLLNIGSIDAHAYYHADGNGNITCLINSNNVVVARYNYDPFGNILSMSGPLAEANLYRFSSKECHPNSGLVYYLYRYYEPKLQRWINRDPVGEKGFVLVTHEQAGRQQNTDLYIFVKNSPLSHTDSFGLDFSTWCGAGTGYGGWTGNKETPPRSPQRDQCVYECQQALQDCTYNYVSDVKFWSGLLGAGGVTGAATSAGGHATGCDNQKQKRFYNNKGNPTVYFKNLRAGAGVGILVSALFPFTDCYSSYFGCMSGCPYP